MEALEAEYKMEQVATQTMVDRDVRRHDPRERVPAVPSAAAGEQGDFALVWRMSGGLDHVHVVLPGGAVRRLRVRPSAAAMVAAAASGGRSLGFGRGGDGLAADRAERLPGSRRPARIRRGRFCCCWRARWGCRILPFRRPARWFRPGSAAPGRSDRPIGSMRCRTSARWRRC